MQLIRAMGRKLDTSSEEPFLWIRTVVEVFQEAGMSHWDKHLEKMSARISPLGSTALRWRYSTLSEPGAELDRERSFLVISAGVG